MKDEKKKARERELILSVIREIRNNEDIYNKISDFFLKNLLPFIFPHAQKIQTRPKTMDRVAGKILKKYIGLKDKDKILNKFTDLVAARLIFLRRDQVDQADKTIREYFNVDDTNSLDVAERLNEREFGYLSKHYIVIVDKNWLEDLKKKLKDDEKNQTIIRKIDELIDALSGGNANADGEADAKKRVTSVSMEIQVRTWLQHVWAELSHDSVYKANREIPEELRRSWNAIAAILENTDNDIMNSLIQLERFQNNNAYYIAEELEEKIANLEVIAAVQMEDPLSGDEKEMKIASLKDTRDELKRLYSVRGKENEDVLKEIACKLGEQYVPASTSAEDDDCVREWKNEPADPHKLLCYLCARGKEENGYEYLLSGDVLLISMIRFSMQRCDDMIKTSSDLPWAFAGKTAFQLIMLLSKGNGEPAQDEIDSIFNTILRLIDLCNVRSVANLKSERIVATADSRKALDKLTEFVAPLAGRNEPFCNGSDSAPLMKCVKMLLDLGKYAHFGQGASGQLDLPPAVIVAGGCDSLYEPEGSAHPSKTLEDFKSLFEKALEGKTKIAFYTGGGEKGICSLRFNPDNDMPKEDRNPVYRFGIRTDHENRDQECYKKHSVYEALCEWEALKNQQYRFDDVALVGFGLGRISSLECCIALALGARVTVIGHKAFHSYERTFDNIPYWSSHPSLVRLPSIRGSKPRNFSFESMTEARKDTIQLCRDAGFPEPLMLRVFMLFKPYHKNDYLQQGKNYDMTLLIHRIKALRTLINPDDDDLADLDNEKRLSEQHRLLFFETLCDDAGIVLSDVPPVSVPGFEKARGNDRAYMKCLLNTIAEDFNKLNVDPYAFGEREHARWYIERWLQGTRYGDNKIDRNVSASQKRNPCMVAWYDLDDDTIVKDTEFLNRYVMAQAVDQSQDIKDGIFSCFPAPEAD